VSVVDRCSSSEAAHRSAVTAGAGAVGVLCCAVGGGLLPITTCIYRLVYV
jgi:hypothetical protein